MNPRSKTVYLVRHGENEISLNDPRLTPKGQLQARSLRFDLSKIDGVVCSPTRRTVETGIIISKNLGVPYQKSELVKERIDFLDVPGMGYTNFRKLCARSSDERDYILPNAESSYTSGLRLEYFMTRAANMIENGLVIVTHQGIISDYLRNKFQPSLLEEKSATFTKIREDAIANCSITRVDVAGHSHVLQYIGKK